MKTFYSVKFIAPGMLDAATRWFDDHEKALHFIYCEDVRCGSLKIHNLKNEKRIKEIEKLIQEQKRP